MAPTPTCDYELTSLADLEFIIGQLDTGRRDQFWDFDEVLWYRGQPDDYPLRPGFLRDSVSQARLRSNYDTDATLRDNSILGFERQFNKSVKRRAASFVDPKVNLTHLYFLMQHHGVPTRLLDWTENVLAAVFFAVNTSHSTDGWVYIIDPSEMFAKQSVTRSSLHMESD